MHSSRKSSGDFAWPFLSKDCSGFFTGLRSQTASLGRRRLFFSEARQDSTKQPPATYNRISPSFIEGCLSRDERKLLSRSPAVELSAKAVEEGWGKGWGQQGLL